MITRRFCFWVRALLGMAVLSVPALTQGAEPSAAAPASIAPLRIHLLSGAAEYNSEASLREFAKFLEAHYTVQCTASWAGDKGNTVDGLDQLPQADLLVVFARRLDLPEDQMKPIRQHWEQGKPIIGIRTASHAFQENDNRTFDRQVLGGNYQGHYGDGSVQVTALAGAEDHPVLRGVKDFTSGKLYKESGLAPDTVVLQNGSNGQFTHPVTFVHTYRGGRVLYTSLGIPDDFTNPNFRQMLVNAIFWTTHRDPARMSKQPPHP